MRNGRLTKATEILFAFMIVVACCVFTPEIHSFADNPHVSHQGVTVQKFEGEFATGSAVSGGYVVRVDFPSPGEYRIVDTPDGQRIDMNGYGQLMVPGKPILPSRNLLIALPPGARVQSIDVEGDGAVELPGTYRMAPAPPIMPLVDQERHPAPARKMWDEWKANRASVSDSDNIYPRNGGRLIGTGTLRKYAYASVSVYPFRYRPESGRLIRYGSAIITVRYRQPSPERPEFERVAELLRDRLADDRASRLFVNYRDVEELYRPEKNRSGYTSKETHDYVIITTSAFVDAITSSRFLVWKEALGHRIKLVLTSDTEIASQPGNDLAEQIRNFLMSYYVTWGIEYVLLVGNYLTIPMRYCYPDSTNHWNNAGVPNAESGEVPTDAYYADLSEPDTLSWDLDRDGFYGEFGQDMPDLLAEVYVGRIPTNNLTRVTYTLDKLVTFEQDTGDWKDQALHAGAIWYFTNEDYSGYSLYDGATCMHLMATNAPYRVYHRTGVSDWIRVDQSTAGTGWVYLGTFEFDNSHTQGVMLTNEADGYVVADGVKLVYEGPLTGEFSCLMPSSPPEE